MTRRFEDSVREANEMFYEAFARGDLSLMKEVWLRDSKAKCVHPGWPMLYGWEAVEESWKNIFEGGEIADIEITDVKVQIAGKLAWVICIEKIGHRAGNKIRVGYAQSVNVFERSDSSWLLVVHHASPVPEPRGGAGSAHNLQ